jgi:hypothetical protein
MEHPGDVARLALGYEPPRCPQSAPQVSFELAVHFAGLSACAVAPGDRATAEKQILDAFWWCHPRFPLSVRRADGTVTPTIQQFRVGHALHEGELLSASSSQAIGTVLLAANWPLRSIYRLGSLVAHESMHQALFQREIDGGPVRRGSLGFSPWKNSLRAGRLVWHGYWTFSCQFALLGEAVLQTPKDMRLVDPGIDRFLAEMFARISVCRQSLSIFEILSDEGFQECEAAFSIVERISDRLSDSTEYGVLLEIVEREVFDEFESWSLSLKQKMK